MSSVTRSALRVYAALSELKSSNEDVLDALIPFFEPILEVMNGKIFDPHVFATGVQTLYKWRFTGDIASHFVERFERRGFLRKEASGPTGGIWIVTYTNTNQIGASDHLLPVVELIIDEFESFPPRVTDLLSYHKTRDELKDILIRFLVTMDAQTEGAYTPALGDLAPAGDAAKLIAQLPEGGRPLHANDRYMCARFIRHILRKRPEFTPHLTRLASIALLTEVVEDFLKPTHAETRTDITIILDAPIALDLLGCSGDALRSDIRSIYDALKNVGAKFVVLPISCVEMQRNLRSMLSLSPDQRHGYTHSAMIRREVETDVVQAIANNPEKALEAIGIVVRPLDLNSHPGSHRYFNAEHHEDFLNSITWGNLIAAKEHDATCMALVMRLREGKHSSDIFKAA